MGLTLWSAHMCPKESPCLPHYSACYSSKEITGWWYWCQVSTWDYTTPVSCLELYSVISWKPSPQWWFLCHQSSLSQGVALIPDWIHPAIWSLITSSPKQTYYLNWPLGNVNTFTLPCIKNRVYWIQFNISGWTPYSIWCPVARVMYSIVWFYFSYSRPTLFWILRSYF